MNTTLNNSVRQDAQTCTLCPHACALREGQTGLCKVRVNHNGTIRSNAYGRITSLALDPIEKKPLAHFRPGSMILSVGSYGCNMRCPFCQNASIAQADENTASWQTITPQALVDLALKHQPQGNIGIAYTYNEPLVNYEFLLDTVRLAHKQGLVNALVSNGMINDEPLQALLPFIDAANIDLKAFTQTFYTMTGGYLDTVKHTIETMAACPTCHLEVTTLVIPDENDSVEEIEAIAQWLASLDPTIPYHVSRFFPCYKMTDKRPTPVRHIYQLAEHARAYLRHVYTGNC